LRVAEDEFDRWEGGGVVGGVVVGERKGGKGRKGQERGGAETETETEAVLRATKAM